MKDAGPCPKCASRELYVIDEALIPDYQSSNYAYPLTLTAHYGPTGEMGFFGDKSKRVPVRIEAYVCATCAYTELFAKDLEVLAQFARTGAGNVRKLAR
jgi:predicted nucleic-acid-binding Zn-ribbon protein